MEQIDIILIERYFEGDLNEQERAVFAQRLQADARFAEAFRFEQDILAGIETAGNQRLRERLDAIYQEEIKHGATIRTMRPLRRWWMLAAAVVAGLLIGWWWLGSQPAAQKLASQYLEQPFQVEDSFFRGETDENQARTNGLVQYRNGDFEAAAASMETVVASGTAKAGDYFLAGLCQLFKASPDFAIALDFFTKANALDPAAYTDEINWYSALAKIQLKNEPAAKAVLEKLANSKSSRNAEQARELLEVMGK